MEAVSEPQLSPDGQWVAYLVTTSDREADEVRSAIWMVSWDGTQHVQLTKPSSSVDSPRWSPDGRYLSYLAKTGEAAEHSQVMLLDRRGGEPRALTSVSDDIESYAWSPDGRRLVLVMETDNEPSTAAFPAKGPKPIVIDSVFFKEDVTGYIGRSQKQHLYLFDVAADKLEPLGLDEQYNDVQPAWSPDGTQIAFVRTQGACRGHGRQGGHRAHRGPPRRRAAPTGAPLRARLSSIWPGARTARLVAFLQGLESKYTMYMHDELWVVPASGRSAARAHRPARPLGQLLRFLSRRQIDQFAGRGRRQSISGAPQSRHRCHRQAHHPSAGGVCAVGRRRAPCDRGRGRHHLLRSVRAGRRWPAGD